MKTLTAVALTLIALAAPLHARPSGTIGRVSFSLEDWRSGASGPAMRFTFSAEGIWSCSEILAELRAEGSTIVLGPFSSRPRPGPCPPTVVPAVGTKAIALSPGKYTLRVVNGSASDEYAVEVTPALITVKPVRAATASGVAHESEMRIRKNSFALSCGALKEEQAFCTDVVRAIAGASGITEIAVPAGAHGWQVQMNGYWYNEPTHYFSYASDAALAEAERILTAKQKAVAPRTGFGLGLALWDGQYFYPPPTERSLRRHLPAQHHVRLRRAGEHDPWPLLSRHGRQSAARRGREGHVEHEQAHRRRSPSPSRRPSSSRCRRSDTSSPASAS